MIAAKRPRIGRGLKAVPGAVVRWTRRLDRSADRALERAHPTVLRVRLRATRAASASLAWLGPRTRPPAAAFFRALAFADAAVRRGCALAARAATAASAVVTPRRAIAATIVAAGLGLAVSQFLDYRGVEIGQPGYSGLETAAPTVDVKTAGEAHAFLLLPLGALAACFGLACARRESPRLSLGVIAIGLLSVAVVLLVDRPAGLDAGAETSRFAGASAVLDDGFYAELAAAAGLVIAGLLYYARPCRIRISSSGRAASARRRRPRRQDSSPARVARSA
ncbi:MAG TPA: hypothetical protein VHR18_07950 [Solirubrobacterales bacterium]|jgi:hypothetical protein|nr:hypothetical protein [Solirubrobacterales bacterium]